MTEDNSHSILGTSAETLTIDRDFLNRGLEAWLKECLIFQESEIAIKRPEFRATSANVQLSCEPNSHQLNLVIKDDILSFNSFDEIAKLCSAKEAFNQAPSAMKEFFQSLDVINISQLQATFNLKNDKPELIHAEIKFTLAESHWIIWKDKIEVSNLTGSITLDNSNIKIKAIFSLFGEIDIAGTAVAVIVKQLDGNVLLSGNLKNSQTLPLASFAAHYFPSLGIPENLKIDSLETTWNSASGLEFNGSIANKPYSWSIFIGKQRLKFSDLTFKLIQHKTDSNSSLTINSSDKFSGFFKGKAQLDSLSLDASYQLPGNFCLSASILKIKLSEIIEPFKEHQKLLPSGMDFILHDTQIAIKEKAGKMSFIAKANIPNIGSIGIQITENNISTKNQTAQKNKGLTAIVELNIPELHPAKIPGFGFLEPLNNFVKPKNTQITIASDSDITPEITDGDGLTSISKTIKGIMCTCEWHIDTREKFQKFFHSLLNLDSVIQTDILVDMSDRENPSTRLTIDVESTLDGNHFSGGLDLSFSRSEPIPIFSLYGQSQFVINKHQYMVNLNGELTPEGLGLEGVLLGTINLHGLKVSDLAVLCSIDWAGIPGIGFSGQVDIGKTSLALTMLFDSAQGSIVLAGAISDLSALDLAKNLAKISKIPRSLNNLLSHISIHGTHQKSIAIDNISDFSKKDLNNIRNMMSSIGFNLSTDNHDLLLVERVKNKAWTLADRKDNLKHYSIYKQKSKLIIAIEAQAYICSTPCNIGNLEFAQGFYLNAALQVAHFQAEATINVQPGRGFSIDAETQKPLIIGNRNFLCFSDASGKKGPAVSISTFNQPQQKNANLKKPHIYFSGKLQSMGFEIAEAYAMINNQGFLLHAQFHNHEKIRLGTLSGEIASKWSLSIDIAKVNNMTGSYSSEQSLDLTLKVAKVGHINFKEKIQGAVSISFCKNVMKANFFSECRVLNERIKIEVALSANSKSLSKIEHLIAKKLEDELTKIYKNVDKFIEDIGKGIIKGLEDETKLAKTLHNEFNQDTQSVIKAFERLGKSEQQLGNALKNGLKISAKATAQELQSMNKSAESIAKTLKHGFNEDTKAVGNTLKSIGVNQESINTALKAAGAPAKEVKSFCDSAFKDVGKTAKKLKKSLKKIF